MTRNEALILDYLLHIRATCDEICSDVRDVKSLLDLIEGHVAKCTRPRLRFVMDAPNHFLPLRVSQGFAP